VAKHLLAKGRPKHPFFFKSMDEERGPFLDRIKEILAKEAPESLGPAPDPKGP
jgi:hypothetical protein